MKLIYLFFLISVLLIGSHASLFSFDYNEYIRFHWKGAITSHSILLKVFLYIDKLRVKSFNTLLVLYIKSAGDLIQNFRVIPISFQQEAYPVTPVDISSLLPATTYTYTFIFTQDLTISQPDFIDYCLPAAMEFSLKTLNIALKPYNFTFGAASCAETGSENQVFKNITDENLEFFLHMGDLFYGNIAENNPNLYCEAYYKVFASQVQKTLWQSTPIVYMWDDHDYGPNNSGGTSASKPAATTAYKKFVTYHTLHNNLPTDDFGAVAGAPRAVVNPNAYLSYSSNTTYGIFRSFIVGRCLFILMDLRSYMGLIVSDVLGEEQKSWLENQLRFAANNPNIKQVFILSSYPWLAAPKKNSEWEDYDIVQNSIGKLIKQHVKDNNKKILMLCGDAHMIAFDDGISPSLCNNITNSASCYSCCWRIFNASKIQEAEIYS